MTAGSPRDGLPHNTILSIAQSREGYLWLATWEGLVRYNGNEFRVFDHSRQPALIVTATRSPSLQATRL